MKDSSAVIIAMPRSRFYSYGGDMSRKNRRVLLRIWL